MRSCQQWLRISSRCRSHPLRKDQPLIWSGGPLFCKGLRHKPRPRRRRARTALPVVHPGAGLVAVAARYIVLAAVSEFRWVVAARRSGTDHAAAITDRGFTSAYLKQAFTKSSQLHAAEGCSLKVVTLRRCQVGSLDRSLNMQTWKSSIISPGAKTGGCFPRFVPLSSASRRASTLKQLRLALTTPASAKSALTKVTDEDAHLYIPHRPS